MHYVNSAMTKKLTFSDKVSSQTAVIVTIHTALKNVKILHYYLISAKIPNQM